jgi:ribosomal protein S27AE
MATAPRRETLIALRARRTAHQVSTALHLHQHSHQLLQQCSNCGRDFLPERDEQTECGTCVRVLTYQLPYETPVVVQPRPRLRPSVNWGRVFRVICLILACVSVLFAFAALIYAGVKLNLARVFGL